MSGTVCGGEEAAMRRNVSWRELSPGRRAALAVLGCVQVALAIAAWRDLAKRPAAEVNGSKRIWAAIIAINWVGPLAYFAKGRRA
jgi:hypothetical protein